MIRELSNIPLRDAERRCELCRRPYVGSSDLKDICRDCCQELGGGKYSARGIVSEAKAMTAERR